MANLGVAGFLLLLFVSSLGFRSGVGSASQDGAELRHVDATREKVQLQGGHRVDMYSKQAGQLFNRETRGKPEVGVRGQGTASGASGSSSVLSFTSTNEYPPITWSPWINLAEPHREALLRADSTEGDAEKDVFVWTLPEEGGAAYEGREIRHVFKKTGRKKVILTQIVLATGEVHKLKSYVMVKYVRREIRELHDNDREAFLTAMETVYRLPTSRGNEIYGSDYKGIDYFVQMHLDGAGVKDCDHWHDDAGIMTHHVGYTLQFEQALQLVDPSVTVPYWEYTLEAASGLPSLGDSVLFDDDWFGDYSPDNQLHTVTKGRWAYLKIMNNAWDYVHNPYGLLRSPWNLDPTPYVTRHNTTNSMVATDMVDCSMYESCFQSNSLKEINSCLNGETHGPVHILVGGQWGNAHEDFITKVGYYEMVPLVTKYLWRKGYLRLPESCEHGLDCKTTCPPEIYESKGMSPYDVLVEVNAPAWAAHTTGGAIRYNSVRGIFEIKGHEFDDDFQTGFWAQMLASFCSPGFVGEMYTSAAPYDPVFWVVHPTSDRFLAWRRMLARREKPTWNFDETWGYRHAMVVGETGMVCNWDGIEYSSGEMPTCSKGICGGHNEEDLLPFKVKIGEVEVKLTNSEWMDFIYPTNDDLPYMYNNFKWDHCTEQGYDLGT